MVDWINLSQNSGSGYELISVTASANTGSSRTTYLTVSGHSTYASVEVVQDAFVTIISISPSAHTFSYTGGTQEFTINSNVNWDIVSYPNWLQLSSLSGTSGTTGIIATANSNTSSSQLTSNIIVSGATSSASSLVEQEASPVSIVVSQDTFTVPYTGGTYLFTVTSNVPWSTSTLSTVSGTISPVSGGTGTTTVTLDINQNTSQVGINDSFNVFGSGASVTVSITQIGTPEGYLVFKIVSGGTITWYPSEYADNKVISYKKNGMGSWITITASSTTVINVAANDYVEFKGDNTTYGVATEGCSFGGTAVFDVEGNVMSLIDSTNFNTLFVLPGNYAFQRLFMNSNVRYAHNLQVPATGLTSGCYRNMFGYCPKLETAPELPALTMKPYCYFNMFYDCYSLNYVKCLATDISANSCTYRWLSNVSSSGTFVKASSMTGWTTGGNGIPNNWTVENA